MRGGYYTNEHDWRDYKAEFPDSAKTFMDKAEKLVAGYLPVEPVQLEVLGDEEIFNLGFATPYKIKDPKLDAYTKGVIDGSKSTIAHNEAKGQLYRTRS